MDDVLSTYVAAFEEAEITGRQLLCMSYRELEVLNITKLAHQELILEAISLLSELVSAFEYL